MLAVGHDVGRLTLWTLNDGEPKLLRTLNEGRVAPFQQFAVFSSDGKWLAYVRKNRQVIIRNLETHEERGLTVEHRVPGDRHGKKDVAFSPDSKLLAIACSDGKLRLWNVMDWGPEITFSGQKHMARSVAFSPDGKLVAAGSYDGEITIWDRENPGTTRPLPATRIISSIMKTIVEWRDVNSLAFSPDGILIAAALGDNTVRVWNLTTEEQTILLGHEAGAQSVGFSPDGRLISSSGGNTIKLWDTDTLGELETLSGHSAQVMGTAFAPDGRTLASASMDYSVRLWNVEPEKETRFLEDAGRHGPMAFAPNGKTMVTLSNGRLQFWDLESGGKKPHGLGVVEDVRYFTISRDGVVAMKTDDDIQLWDMTTSQRVTTCLAEDHIVVQGYCSPMAFSPDGCILAVGALNHLAKLWDTSTGSLLHSLSGHEGIVYCVAFSPDGKLLATGGRDKTVRVWNVETGQPLQVLRGHEDRLNSVAFSRDGSLIASASYDNTIRVWHWMNEQSQCDVLDGHSASVYTVAFSEDWSTLITGSVDRTVKFWDVATWKQRFSLPVGSRVFQVAISRDERTLATSGLRGATIRLWRAATEAEVRASGWYEK